MKKLITLFISLIVTLSAATLNAPPFPDYGLIIPSERADLVDIQPLSNKMQVKQGWKMYGYDNGVFDVNKTFSSLQSVVKIVWHYNHEDDIWYAYSPDMDTMNIINNYPNIKNLTSIDAFEGFWVYGLQDMNITLNPDYGIPEELIVITTTIPQDATNTGGEFEISVSPLDDHQNLISDNLTKDNFYFQSVSLFNSDGTKLTDVNMSVTQVVISKTSGSNAALNNLVLDLDASGSMSSNDPDEKRKTAATNLASLVDTNSRVAVLDFGYGSDSGLTNSRLLQSFTNDKTLLTNAISKVQASGGTPLYESLLDSISLLKDSYGTKTIIVFTDGAANSETNYDNVISQANANGISIYTIGLGSGVNETALQGLAQSTGGLYAYADDADELDAVFNSVGTGTLKGRVLVKGLGVFNDSIADGNYTMKGQIGFDIAGTDFVEDMSLNIEIK